MIVNGVDSVVEQMLEKRKLQGKQLGLTLVELLVSLALSAILMAGLTQVFVGMRMTERTEEALSQMQEAGRIAINRLAREIRGAGYMGCSSTLAAESVRSTLFNAPTSFQPQIGIQGWEADNTAPLTVSASVIDEELITVVGAGGKGWSTSMGNALERTRAVSGTDIIKVWNVAGTGATAVIEGEVTQLRPAGGMSSAIAVSKIAIKEGDVLVLNDCEFVDYVQACSINSGQFLTLALSGRTADCSPGNNADIKFGVSIENSPQAYKLNSSTFYIGKRANKVGNPPALFRRSLGSRAISSAGQELVEGVENMQILYGENRDNDSGNGVDYFVPANQINDWHKVVSVRITLLIQSVEDNLLSSAQPYSFNGVVYDGSLGSGQGELPMDKRLRRVFSSTISLRNRTLNPG